MIESLMTSYYIQVLFYILAFEIFLVVLLLFSIFFVSSWRSYQENKRKIEQRFIAQKILDYMKGKIPLNEVQKHSRISSKTLLLEELERFNQRFAGEDWEKVRNTIVEQYLFDTARKFKENKNWRKRAFAAKTFSLYPLMRDKEAILALMDDPIFLVRSHVIPAVLELNIKEGIIKILKQMSQERGYSHYYYRDSLLSGKSINDFRWIEEVAATTDDDSLHLACLDVLSGKMILMTEPFLLRDLESSNPSIKLAALKVFANNPQKESLEVLLNHVHDPKDEMREVSLSGLEHFRSHKTLSILENALNDPSWQVSTKAAMSLKNMGRLGHEILEKQNPELNKNAYEVAHYTLQLDW